MENKTHYRKVFKSDHLSVSDLEEMQENGDKLIFTIDRVVQYLIDPLKRKSTGVIVAGKRVSANIAYFKEKIKPWVINASNSKDIKIFNDNSSFVDDWGNTLIELYIDPDVQFKGEKVGGIKVRKVQPKVEKTQKPFFTKDNFLKAKEAKASIETITKRYSLTDEVKKEYINYCNE